MAKKKKKHQTPLKAFKSAPEQQQLQCYEGDRLDCLLVKLGRSIEEAKQSKGQLPEKIWIKQQFAVGVNDITRVLERMPGSEAEACSNKELTNNTVRAAPLVPLQVILLAADVNPRMLTRHIPNLAFSRQVPVMFVKDNRGGSLRLGELVKLKTAMAIGVKARDSTVNRTINEVLHADSLQVETPEIEPNRFLQDDVLMSCSHVRSTSTVQQVG